MARVAPLLLGFILASKGFYSIVPSVGLASANAGGALVRALGAVASASRLHRVGRGFESLSAHHLAPYCCARFREELSFFWMRLFPNGYDLLHTVD